MANICRSLDTDHCTSVEAFVDDANALDQNVKQFSNDDADDNIDPQNGNDVIDSCRLTTKESVITAHSLSSQSTNEIMLNASNFLDARNLCLDNIPLCNQESTRPLIITCNMHDVGCSESNEPLYDSSCFSDSHVCMESQTNCIVKPLSDIQPSAMFSRSHSSDYDCGSTIESDVKAVDSMDFAGVSTFLELNTGGSSLMLKNSSGDCGDSAICADMEGQDNFYADNERGDMCKATNVVLVPAADEAIGDLVDVSHETLCNADKDMSEKMYRADNEINEQSYSAGKDIIEKKYSTNKDMNEQLYSADEEINEKLYIADNDVIGEKYSADKEISEQLYSADKEINEKLYIADKNIRENLDSANNKRNEKLFFGTENEADEMLDGLGKKACENVGGSHMEKNRNIVLVSNQTYRNSVCVGKKSNEYSVCVDKETNEDLDYADQEINRHSVCADKEIDNMACETMAPNDNVDGVDMTMNDMAGVAMATNNDIDGVAMAIEDDDLDGVDLARNYVLDSEDMEKKCNLHGTVRNDALVVGDMEGNMMSDKNNKHETGNNLFCVCKPKHLFNAISDLRGREIGLSNHRPPSLFREQVQGSLQMVQRLQLKHRLRYHEGCVNALHFNRIGTLLASGSDDLQIVLWNWEQNRPSLTYDSGHRSNVFQAKFLPFSGDCHVVSCARDGQVRLAELSLTGVCKNTRKLAQHRGASHKLALDCDSPHVFLSCGEDAITYQIDLRGSKPQRLVLTKENDQKVPLYSIHLNPVNPHEFCTAGRDPYIRIYDIRKINEAINGGIVKKYFPTHLEGASMKSNVTCACYSYNGSEILGSYNDDDIYLFGNTPTDGTSPLHQYTGHRNNVTVKGVSFYGPHSEFVISGSDCGHVFIWDKKTEHVVQFLEADDSGVVNVLEPHPCAPILATSGLDHDVKIWSPFSDQSTHLDGFDEQRRKNLQDRLSDLNSDPETIDSQMLWFIMHHFRRSARRRLRQDREQVSSSSSECSDSESDDTSEDQSGRPMQCQPS